MPLVQHPIVGQQVPEEKGASQKPSVVQNLYRPEILARDGRYVAYENRVICDCYSGLEWLPGPDTDISWEVGWRWVGSVSTGGGGWRLPTLLELQGLFKKNRAGDNISPLFAIGVTDVWSCETADESSAWGFNFLPGNQFWTHKTSSRRFRVLAVRSRRYYVYTLKRGTSSTTA
ncbi:MAG: DUF1566 domain-containing protein [Desulfocapsaceae bacterium]|nr:DUF1566 domain-containing protein [Desulfocapsaceae bacterium]